MALVTGESKHVSVSEALDAQLQQMEGDPQAETEIVLDLAGVEKISSEEINLLIRTYGIVRQSGSTLVIENAHEHLCHVFTLTRLDRLIKIREPSR